MRPLRPLVQWMLMTHTGPRLSPTVRLPEHLQTTHSQRLISNRVSVQVGADFSNFLQTNLAIAFSRAIYNLARRLF